MTVMRQRQALRRAAIRVFERKLDLVLDIASGPLPNTAALRAGTRSHAATEERGEEVGEGIRVAKQFLHLLLRHRAESAAGPADIEAARERIGSARLGTSLLVHPPVGAELVVLLTFGRIAENFVGLVDLLEARFGGLVARIDVGMELAGQFAEGLLDLLLRRSLRDAKRLVVILEFHRSSGPYRLKKYQSQPASDRDSSAATTERPVAIHERHPLKSDRFVETADLVDELPAPGAGRERVLFHQWANPLHDFGHL